RDPARPTPLVAPEARGSEELTFAEAATADGVSATDVLLADEEVDERAVEGAPGAEPSDGLLPADPTERPTLDAADIQLALRYLTEISVIVEADPLDDASARVVAEAGRYAGAQVVIVVPRGGRVP